MARPKPQVENPWVSKALFDALQTRCASAEQCLRDLITLIDPEMLVLCEYDWCRATHRIVKGEDPDEQDHSQRPQRRTVNGSTKR